ncbi:hypothetical protein ONZ45_g13019 [Pleurotus djamor]|nr:hypothetical protein ONZ45_g13019 [Pleurotus djamor]
MEDTDAHIPPRRSPLPKLQLAIALLIQTAEPLTASVILPFINQFVQESGITGGDERKVGYFAGIIGTLFFLSECAVVLFWSRLSDRIGRKPVLLMGCIGIFLAVLGLGSSNNYFAFTAARTLQGAFIGSVGIAKNITDNSNVADAFAFLPPIYPFGGTVGPLIGGFLANPARRWPSTFAISIFPLLAFLFAAVQMNETLPSIVTARRRGRDYTDAIRSSSPAEHDPLLPSETAATSPPVLSVLVKPVVLCLVMISFRAAIAESYRTLLPLMFSTSIRNGGLDYSAARIGSIIGLWGFFSGIFQLLCFAQFIHGIGPKRTFQIAYGSYVICFGMFPVMNYFAMEGGNGNALGVMVALLIQQCFATLGSMSYGCLQLFVIDAIPEPSALATVNGVAHIVNAMMKAIGPALASSLPPRNSLSYTMRGSEPTNAITPLPRLQLAIILLIQCAEPLTASVIFPFINQFVQESGITGGDERKIGYYAGIIGSLFFLSECFVVLYWSRLSDRIGRKPVLLAGMLGLGMTIVCAGATKSYYVFALSRSLQGAFNGNIGVAKNVMVEITDSTNIADAFGWLPPVWTLGNTFGSVQTQILLDGPMTDMSKTTGGLCLHETLPAIANQKGRRKDPGNRLNYGSIDEPPLSTDNENSTSETPKSPEVRAVLVRPVLISLTTLSFQAVTMESFRALMPLMFSTSIHNGGLELNSARIGTILATWGLCNGAFQLVFFARTIRKFGPKTTFRVAYGSYLLSYVLFPVMSYFAKQANGVDWRVLLTLLIQQTSFVLGAMSYGSNQLFIIAAIPDKSALATVNGVAQIVNSMMRALAPALASSFFSLSVELGLAGGYFVYFFCGLAHLSATTPSPRPITMSNNLEREVFGSDSELSDVEDDITQQRRAQQPKDDEGFSSGASSEDDYVQERSGGKPKAAKKQTRKKRREGEEEDEEGRPKRTSQKKRKRQSPPEIDLSTLTPEEARKRRLDMQLDAIIKPKKSSRSKKRKNDDELDRFADDEVARLRESMINAADQDDTAVKEGSPALQKLKLLPEVMDTLRKASLAQSIVDNNLLQGVRRWLEPLPDRSIPALNIQREFFPLLKKMDYIDSAVLRESGLGKVVIFYTKSKRIQPDIARIANDLVSSWSRPIIKRSASYRDRIIPVAQDESAPSRPTGRSLNAILAQGREADKGRVRKNAVNIPRSELGSYTVAPKSSVGMLRGNVVSVEGDVERRRKAAERMRALTRKVNTKS